MLAFIHFNRTVIHFIHFATDKKCSLIVCSLFFYFSIWGQQWPCLTFMELDKKLNQRRSFQFSSMAVKGDTIFLPAEKCDSIHMINKKTLAYIDGFKINGMGAIEGIAVYKDRYLYLLDESKIKVYRYDLVTKDIIVAADHTLLGNARDALEGIAINPGKERCYVLYEVEKKIKTFRIRSNGKLEAIVSEENISTFKNWTRGTDLLFDNNRLYVLKSRKNSFDEFEYGIDTIPIDSNGKPLTTQAKRYVRLDSCRQWQDEYDTNLEGLVLNGSKMYVISDNHYSGEPSCDSDSLKLTLFFSFDK